MNKPAEIGQEARESLALEWSASRTQHNFERFLKRKRKRRQVAVIATSLVLALVVGIGLWFKSDGRFDSHRSHDHGGRIASSPPGRPSTLQDPKVSAASDSHASGEPEPYILRFNDGSQVEALDQKAHIEVAEKTSSQLRLKLKTGAARFDVAPNPERVFQVEAGDVRVSVLGTRFEVAHLESGEVAVDVLEGRVAVSVAEASPIILRKGEARVIAPLAFRDPADIAKPKRVSEIYPNRRPGLERDRIVSERPKDVQTVRESGSAPPADKVEPTWETFASQGEFFEAARLLKQDPEQVNRRDPGSLMLAADSMRYAGDYPLALRYLETVEKQHTSDRRAATAAFAWGLILLTQLNASLKAAQVFAQVAELNPSPALAEDALAREVEAWHRAGKPDRARNRAQVYLERYPQGHRASAVRHFGGLR